MAQHRALALALALALCAACAGSEPPVESPTPAPHPIRHLGPYTHRGAGATFPERVAQLPRVDLHAYDGEELDVSATYQADERMRITGFVYPAGPAVSDRLRDHFLTVMQHVVASLPSARVEGASVLPLTGAPEGVAGYEGRFDHAESVSREHLRLFQCGGWFLKLRASFQAGYTEETRRALDELGARLSCPQIARNSPAGELKQVLLDPAMGEGEAVRWMAYGVGLVVWTKAHLTPQQRAFGVPDHDPTLYRDALSQALELHRQVGSEPPSPFFDRLAQIEHAGLLDELVWSTHLGFLEPPADVELARLRAFRAEHMADFEYRPRARIGAQPPPDGEP